MDKGKGKTNSCEQIRAWLGPWLDGELPAAQCTEVKSHLEHCAKCRKVAQDNHATAAWVRQSRRLERVEPSVDVFWSRLRARLPERRTGWDSLWQPLRQLWMQPRYQLALAGGVALVVLVTLFLGGRTPVETPSVEGTVAAEPGCLVESVETGVPGGSLMVYHSESENLTVVWLFTDNTGDISIMTSPDERQT